MRGFYISKRARSCKRINKRLVHVVAQLEKICGVLFTLKGAVSATAQSVTRLDGRVEALEEAVNRYFNGGSASSDGESNVTAVSSNTSISSSPLAFPIPADSEIELDTLELQLSDPNQRQLLVSQFINVMT